MEQWKEVNGYEGLYEVSDQGNVRNTRIGKILKPGKNKKTGYLYVNLCKNNKRKNFYIHRLVAQAFIPNPDNKPTVNHINEDKTDNSVENLEWATMSEQQRHGTRGERVAKTRKEKGCCCKKVYCYELDQTFDSIKEADRLTGVSYHCIGKCCQGKLKTAGKMHWKYVD